MTSIYPNKEQKEIIKKVRRKNKERKKNDGLLIHLEKEFQHANRKRTNRLVKSIFYILYIFCLLNLNKKTEFFSHTERTHKKHPK